MSDNPRGRGRGRGRGDRGDRGGGRGGRGRGGRGRGDTELPFRSGGRGGGDREGGDRGGRGEFRGDFRGRGRGDFGRGDFGGRGGRGAFRGSGNQGPRIFNEGQTVPAPNAQVEKVENANAQALTLGRKKTADSARYPDRPGYGTLGRPVTLYANYMPFAAVGKPVFRYHVHIAKDQGKDLPVKKARQVVRLLLEEHFASDIKNIATDYRSTLISCVDLRLGGDDKMFDVRWKSENEVEYMDEPKVFNVTVGATGTLDPVDLVNYLTSSSVTTPLMHQEQIIGAMNIIIGHQPKTDRSVVTLSGNKHFSLNPAISERMSLGGGLEALRGYFVSVRAATARVLLNVQVKYLACYQEGPLPMVIGEFLRTNSRNTYRLESFLKRMRICANHIVRKTSSGKSRPPAVKSIAGLATPADGRSSASPPRVARHGAGPFDVEFFLEAPGSKPPAAQAAQPGGKGKKGKKPVKAGPAPTGQYISVGAYFKREYKKDLDPDMPVINVGNRQFPMYLPVDVCMVQPGQPVGTKLSPNQTSDVLKFAVMGRKPAQNAQSILNKGAGMLGLEPLNATLAAFGVRVENNLITVQGRVLSPPKIMYAKQKAIMTMAGSWNMKAIQFSRPVPLKDWTYLYVTIERARTYWQNPDAMLESLRKFTSVLRSMGIEAEMPKEGQRVVLNGSNGSDAEVIERAVRQLQDRYKPSMILGVLYGKDTTLYNTIKQVCDVRCGVRNVNVQAEKLAVAQDQYCANVGLKINLKLGGGNQSLRSSDLGLFGNNKTMLVGLDVTHPSPGSSSNAPSVAAIVASVDSNLAQWPAEIRIQGSRNEIVADLDVLMQSRLKLWAKHNKNKYPENIVIYRDGVSEGQYNLVLDNELPLLKRACAAVYPAAETKRGFPAMSIIIVGKRHNTRFYPTSDADADRSANPMPGTVVDRGVSESNSWDFFLQAHSALQGTARPAHYFTIWDEIFYPQHPGTNGARGAADVLQDLTHKMCYLFGRATKAVSVCPPAYYADLVCTRARCYLSDLFDPSLSNPEASVVGTEGAGQVGDDENVLIHPNVKDTMFYI